MESINSQTNEMESKQKNEIQELHSGFQLNLSTFKKENSSIDLVLVTCSGKVSEYEK